MDDDLQAMDTLFSAALYRAACPPSDRLLLYQTGLLEAADAATVAAHIQFCVACRSDIALIAAPPEAGPGERIAAGITQARTLIRAVRTPTTAAPALRGAATRTLAYSAEGYQIVLAISSPPAPGAAGYIEGQLSGAAVPAGAAELLLNDAVAYQEAIDDLGFFAFDEVPAGTYTLRLTLDETQIVIDEFGL